jgi:hypothetical protein
MATATKKPYRPKMRPPRERAIRVVPERPKREPSEFSMADEPKGIAERMIAEGRLAGLMHLKRASILYLFTSADRVGKEGAANAARYPRKLHPGARSKYDFVIAFAQPVWRRFTEKQRQALVYHELLHCGSDESGHFRIEPHDLEEFVAVVKEFGIWDERVKKMAEQIQLWDVPVGGAAGAVRPIAGEQAARQK